MFKRLDKIENALGSAWKWTKNHRQVVKTFIGGVLLLYGGKFTNTILLIQSLSLGSLESFGSALKELKTSYTEVTCSYYVNYRPIIRKVYITFLYRAVMHYEKNFLQLSKQKRI